MTAKEWLSQYRTLDSRITAKMEQRERIRAALTKCTQVITDMPRGGGNHNWTDTLTKCIEAEEELNAMIDSFVDLQRSIWLQIDAIRDPQERQLLEARYIMGWGWTKIGIMMGIERTTVWRIHGRALSHITPPDEQK